MILTMLASDRSTVTPLSGGRVRYIHAPGMTALGAKRNVLCAAAQGEIIAHFDDDDYYGPLYIEGMLSFMAEKNADFAKLFGFFLYQQAHNTFAYWDLETDFPVHWVLHRAGPPFERPNRGTVSGRWGYGFSYVYYRWVWREIRFLDQIHHAEDADFANAVVRRFRSDGKQDFSPVEEDSRCSCLHLGHADNMSEKYPQQIFSIDRLPLLFPHFRRAGSWPRCSLSGGRYMSRAGGRTDDVL
jgi:Glycosyl transferase family 2